MPGDFASDVSFVEIPGVKIAYEMAGQGSSLVFLHGGFLDRRMWDDQFAFFAKSHRVVRYDMRSSGKSETAPTAESFTHHEDLSRFLKALGIERVSLIGLSNYAIALDFAIVFPELVEKLVLVSPGLRAYDYRDSWVAATFAAMLQKLGQQDLSGAAEWFLTMWVDGPYRKPGEVDPQVRDRVRDMVIRSFALSRLAPNSRGIDPPAIGRLSEVRAPTLIVLGEKDAPDILEIGRLIYEGVAGSQLVSLSGVGHSLPMERPNEFNRLVEDFLKR